MSYTVSKNVSVCELPLNCKSNVTQDKEQCSPELASVTMPHIDPVQDVLNYVTVSKNCDNNANKLMMDCVHKKQKHSKKSRKSRPCGCIVCVLEKSPFVLSTELVFKSCVKFLLKIISCVDGYISSKQFSRP